VTRVQTKPHARAELSETFRQRLASASLEVERRSPDREIRIHSRESLTKSELGLKEQRDTEPTHLHQGHWLSMQEPSPRVKLDE
jgi:hypothetical protein